LQTEALESRADRLCRVRLTHAAQNYEKPPDICQIVNRRFLVTT
jgi:hypothetical protein